MMSLRDAHVRYNIVLVVALGLMVVGSATAAQQWTSNRIDAQTEVKDTSSAAAAGERASDIEALRLVIRRLEARIA
ncbi:MAG: hypothetical protein D6723_18530, partial [Acidobacteria bacterium]